MCEAVNKLQTNLVCIVKGHHRSLLIKSARYQIFCNEGTDKEPTNNRTHEQLHTEMMKLNEYDITSNKCTMHATLAVWGH